MKDFSEDWDLLLPNVEFAMNTLKSSVTGHFPFFLFHGRHPIMPVEALTEVVNKKLLTLGKFKKGDLVKIKNVKRKGKFNKKYNPLLYSELYQVVDSDRKGVYDIKAVKGNPKGNHEVKT